MTRELARALGRRVAAARRAANLTQVELAAKLNWPNDTLINYENGRRALSLERLIAIANALDLPPAALLLDDPDLARLLSAYPAPYRFRPTKRRPIRVSVPECASRCSMSRT